MAPRKTRKGPRFRKVEPTRVQDVGPEQLEGWQFHELKRWDEQIGRGWKSHQFFNDMFRMSSVILV